MNAFESCWRYVATGNRRLVGDYDRDICVPHGQRRSALAGMDEQPRVEHLAVSGMPGSGKPAELLAAAGIDREHIAEAARRLVRARALR